MKRVRIRVSLTSAVMLLILALAGTLFVVNVRAGREIADVLGDRFLDRTQALATERLDGFFQPVLLALRTAQSMARDGVMTPADVGRSNAVYLPILRAHPQITSLATGDEEGYSYRIGAEDDGSWLVRVTPAGPPGPPRVASFQVLDAQGRVLRAYEEETTFEPRARPWYVGAQERLAAAGSAGAAEIFWTQPFILNTSKNPGIAAALPFAGPDGQPYMMTFNLMLTKLSDFTASLRPTPHGKAFVLARDEEDQLRVLGTPQDDRFATSEARIERVKRLGNRMPSLAELDQPALEASAARFAEAEREGVRTSFRIERGEDAWRFAYTPYHLGGGRSLWIGVAVPESDMLGPVQAQQRTILRVSALALLGALVLALLLSRVYSRPLRRLAAESERITQLDLGPSEPVRTHVLEAHQLADAQERMREALASFSRYVPTEVVRRLLHQGEAARLGGRVRDVTLLFTDIRGFTTISESLDPQVLTEHLAEYFDGLLTIIHRHGGVVDKMVGDAVMALWGAPAEDPDHVAHAVAAALEMDVWLRAFEVRCGETDRPALVTHLGLASGPAFVGNIGAAQRLNYTAIGDTVNLASRLEGASTPYGVRVLVSSDVRARAGDGFVWRLVDRVAVRGKNVPEAVYEPLGRQGAVDAVTLRFAAVYERAYQHYQERAFREALEVLAEVPAERAKDRSVQYLGQLCHWYLDDAPPSDWDGVARLQLK
jgi:adenylate cyclase